MTDALGSVDNAAMKCTPGLAALLAAFLPACAPGQARQDAIEPARPLDLSRVIVLRDAGECRFDPATEHAFEGLLLIGTEPGDVTSAPVIALGDTRHSPRLESEATEGVPEYRSQVGLPAGSTWHGLPLTELWAEFVAPPETDSLYRRGMTFAANAEQVRAALAASGADVPIRPQFRELAEFAPFSAGTCGGAIMIEPLAGGAALVCDRGC